MSGLATPIKIDITKDTAAPAIKRAALWLTPGKLAKNIAPDLRDITKSHLLALGYSRHRAAAPRNFYATASSRVTTVTGDNSVAISINQQGIAQRYYGGTINAKPGSALTIPANDEAIGKRARDFNNLRIVVFKESRRAALVTTLASNISIGKRGVKAKSSTIERVMYWLVKSVTQKADPSVIPNQQAYRGAIDIALRRITSNLGNAPA